MELWTVKIYEPIIDDYDETTLKHLLIYNLPGHGLSSLLCLGPVASLYLEFLFKFLQSGSQLLDLLGRLAAQRLLVLNLGCYGGELFLLPLDSLAYLSLRNTKRKFFSW